VSRLSNEERRLLYRERVAAETAEETELRRARQREIQRRYRESHPDKVAAETKQKNERISEARRQRRADPEWLDRRRGSSEPVGLLRQRIIREASEGYSRLEDLTVLADFNDPYRLDTGVGHRTGAWFKEHLEIAGVGRIHLRGFHYRLVARGDIQLPNGKPYVNDDKCFAWLNLAAKPARWLGYVDFDRIVDNRNEPPLILVPEDLEPRDGRPGLVSTEEMPWVPRASSLMPRMGLVDSNLVQPYRIILIGEKSSLREELEPLATEIGAELILPSGELSDTLIYDFVRRASIDGRPAVVIHFSDFDPAGNQMPVSDARKIQSLRDFKFPDLQIELHHAALTIEHVRRLGLPSTPLKDGEKRGDRWREVMGQEQTEIDALMALHPGELRRIAREAVAPFYDFDADSRLDDATEVWERDANAALLADPSYAAIRAQIEDATLRVRAGIGEIRRIQSLANDIDVGMWRFEIPACEPEGERPEPLFDSRQPWLEQTRRLKEKRNLGGENGEEVPS
jgi:hypothetical protein